MVALDILSDGFFAAVAGIGFGAISDPPLRAFKMIAILAALGHACRFCLMTYLGVDIATASLFAGNGCTCQQKVFRNLEEISFG